MFKFLRIHCDRFDDVIQERFVVLETLQEDICLMGYQHHVSSCSGPAPLTLAEQELQKIKMSEVRGQQAPCRAPIFGRSACVS